MDIFYFSSDSFVDAAAVSIISLLKNNRSADSIRFYMIDDGIREENKRRLTEMVESYGRKIEYISAPEPSELFDYPFTDRYQMGHSYVRMAIGTLLPDDVERVIALDSDTLITGSLEKLWDYDLEGNILAGVLECIDVKPYKERVFLSDSDYYCNAGVYLIDLKRWREERIEDRIKNKIAEQNGNVFFFEQTLMNYSCAGKIKILPPEYNAYSQFFAFRYKNILRWRKPSCFYSEEQVEKAKRTPAILHFTRNFYMRSRPWLNVCEHPFTQVYRKYKALTPWLDLKKYSEKPLRRCAYRLSHLIPQDALVAIISCLQNTIRPKLTGKNE